jgi:hypothetical protein
MSTLTTMQRAVALGAASLALAASPALAQPDYPATHVTQSPAGAAVGSIDLRTPDAIDAGSTQAPRTSSLAGTTSASTPKVSAVTTSDTGDGLDWGAIAIGAGGILAVGGLLGVAAVAMTHRGHMRTAR